MDGSSYPSPAPSAESGTPAGPFRALLAALSAQNISYCYWKSSRRVQQALAGQSDLDLLVARGDQHRMRRILPELGFKHFPAVAAHADPAMESYLGHDEATGRILHVHLHFCVVIGSTLLKEYRPPWMGTFLQHAVVDSSLPIRTLDPASEVILAVVRSCLELRRTDPVLWRSRARTETKYRLDIEHARRRADPADVRARAAALFSQRTASLLADVVRGETPPWHDRTLRRALRRDMAAWRNCNRLEGATRVAFRAAELVAGKLNTFWLHQPRPWRRLVPGGGFVVAVLGGWQRKKHRCSRHPCLAER